MLINEPILCEKTAYIHVLLRKGDSEPSFRPGVQNLAAAKRLTSLKQLTLGSFLVQSLRVHVYLSELISYYSSTSYLFMYM